MSLSLVQVAGANFRTDETSDELNTKFMNRLGMGKRYLPARLAISRSLAMPSPPDPLADGHEPGKTIKGDTLFGTGTTLTTWLALVVEKSGSMDIDTKALIAFVGAHWKRGLELLDQEWEMAGEDLTQFISRLVNVAELPTSGGQPIPTLGATGGGDKAFSSGEVEVPIGEIAEDLKTKEKVKWSLNGVGGSPHSAIMGGVGSGKTRTAVSMLRSIREQAPVPLIAFDFKGDLGTDPSGGGYHIDEVFEAQTLEPPRKPIPLDVLAIGARDEISISEAASRFREAFSNLKSSRLGEKQRTALHEAATRAFTTSGESCQLSHIQDALLGIYDEKEFGEDGATATMQELCRFPLFEPTYDLSSFFGRSWIIKLPPNVAEDSRTIVVNLVLDALDRHLNSLVDAQQHPDGSRGLRILCMIDEAHQILGTNTPSLSRMIRMSRSKGGAVMLVSQSPDDFKGVDDEFLSEMGLVVAFATNAPSRHAERVLGKGAKLAALQNGQCYAKRRGDQAAMKIKAWE